MSRPSTDLEKAAPSSSIELGDLNANSGSSSSSAGARDGVKAEEEEAFLPQPSTSAPAAQPKKLTAAMIIPIWIALSSSVILFNKYLFSETGLNFPYPIFLTTYHMAFAAVGTRLLRLCTPLLNGLDDVVISRDTYIRSIIPIGALFSGSLILSNMAYLTLSVSFIQMLKAFTPVAILLISFAFRLQEPNRKLAAIIAMISCGCGLAAYGEIMFEPFGFMCQVLAVLFESSRLVMIQILLHGLKMDPLVSLYYYAPVCAVINACILPFTEGLLPFHSLLRVGPLMMLANASVAFSLNVAAVFLIGASSGLVLTLAGVFKDILLITSSTLLFDAKITPTQIFGYSIALGGLILFKTSGGK